MKLIAMINTKKLYVDSYRSEKAGWYWIFYTYDGKVVNFEFDKDSDIFDEFEGDEMSQLDAINVAIANEEAKFIKADAERMMNNAVKNYYAK